LAVGEVVTLAERPFRRVLEDRAALAGRRKQKELKVLSTDNDPADAGQDDTGTAIVTIDDATAALLKRIKAHGGKSVRARAKAEQHEVAMGLLLKQLKEMHPDNWEFLAREHADVGRSRACAL
jgi:hypothetical protein